MKKLGKRLLVVIILGGILYGGYYFLARPTGFTSQVELTTSFFDQLNESDVCETHFNPETTSLCATFITLFDGAQLTVDSVTETASGVTVIVSQNGTTASFDVTFISESVTGLRGVFHSRYYVIDTIE